MHRDICECDIVMELLPLYIDNLTRKDSNELVESHITDCPVCRESFEYMREDFLFENREIVNITEYKDNYDCRRVKKKKMRISLGEKLIIGFMLIYGLILCVIVLVVMYYAGL